MSDLFERQAEYMQVRLNDLAAIMCLPVHIEVVNRDFQLDRGMGGDRWIPLTIRISNVLSVETFNRLSVGPLLIESGMKESEGIFLCRARLGGKIADDVFNWMRVNSAVSRQD